MSPRCRPRAREGNRRISCGCLGKPARASRLLAAVPKAKHRISGACLSVGAGTLAPTASNHLALFHSDRGRPQNPRGPRPTQSVLPCWPNWVRHCGGGPSRPSQCGLGASRGRFDLVGWNPAAAVTGRIFGGSSCFGSNTHRAELITTI